MKDSATRRYRFWQVDAFSRVRYLGNAAAVVFDADTLDTASMQLIARQMNLSETAFLCTPTLAGADYRVRIFTPRSELPFAGHPTIASAHAFYHDRSNSPRGDGILHQECGIGLVRIHVEGSAQSPRFRIEMGAAEARPSMLSRDEVADLLRCAPDDLAGAPIETCSTGLSWLIACVRSLRAIQGISPDLPRIDAVCKAHGAVGLSVYAQEAEDPECQVHVRSFAPGEGVPEDPVCGSGNGAVALHIARHLRVRDARFEYVAEQGLEMGYRGRVHAAVSADAGSAPRVTIAGEAVTVMEGELLL